MSSAPPPPAQESGVNSQRTLRRWALAALVTVALVAVLLVFASPSRIFAVLGGANPALGLAGFVLYLGSNLVRAGRLRILLGRQALRLGSAFKVIALYNFFTGVMPGGIGELSLPVHLRSRYGVELSTAVAVLLVTRIYDLAVVVTLLIASIAILHGQLVSLPAGIELMLLIVLAVLVAGLLLIERAVDVGRRIYRQLARIGPITSLEHRLGLDQRFAQVGEALVSMRNQRLVTLGLTVLMWLGNSAITMLVFHALNLPIDLVAALFVNSIVIAGLLLPINSIAGIGVQEAFFSFALLALGVASSEVVVLAFGVHVFLLVYLVALAVIGQVLPSPRPADECGH